MKMLREWSPSSRISETGFIKKNKRNAISCGETLLKTSGLEPNLQLINRRLGSYRRARAGQATVRELITALRELPQAIPAAAQALRAIGYEELSRPSHQSPQSRQEFMDATSM